MDSKDILTGILSELRQSTRELSDNLGYSLTKLYDVQRGKTKRLSDELVGLILEKYPRFSKVWLMTGEGNMLKSAENISLAMPETRKKEQGSIQKKTNIIAPSVEIVSPNNKGIPLVTQTAVAGFGNADFAIQEADVKEYYIVPKFRYHQVDFMIEISGSSMYPKYNSGDVVACTILHDGAFIQWNKCHIVATREQGILCKRLMPGSSNDMLKMVSDNENYPPFEVSKDDITGIALVVGVIRLE